MLAELRSRVGKKPCLFHHHTTEPIRASFDDSATIYATVLRDPVDRYVSLVHHISNFLLSPETPPAYAAYYAELCGVEFCRALARPQVRMDELLEAAAAQPFFSNYYTTLFRSLCQDRVQIESPPDSSSSDLQTLAAGTRNMFTEIGWFSDLDMAFARIVRAYGIGHAGKRMQVAINRSARRRPLSTLERLRYERVLETEYAFVEQLGLTRTSNLSRSA